MRQKLRPRHHERTMRQRERESKRKKERGRELAGNQAEAVVRLPLVGGSPASCYPQRATPPSALRTSDRKQTTARVSTCTLRSVRQRPLCCGRRRVVLLRVGHASQAADSRLLLDGTPLCVRLTPGEATRSSQKAAVSRHLREKDGAALQSARGAFRAIKGGVHGQEGLGTSQVVSPDTEEERHHQRKARWTMTANQ